MKGLILAGGKGTRLQPATFAMNKHMVPILNKPMILYPLETLKAMGCTDIMVVTGGNHVGNIAEFLGDGSEYGVSLTYRVQKEAGGIAQALSLAEGFANESFAVILGDNVFENAPVLDPFEDGCVLFVKSVKDPHRFGVYSQSDVSRLIIEKPKEPVSDKAVLGLYVYTPAVFDFIRTLAPSARGELEITDVNNWCLDNLKTDVVEYEGFWSDAGTPASLKEVIDWAWSKEFTERTKPTGNTCNMCGRDDLKPDESYLNEMAKYNDSKKQWVTGKSPWACGECIKKLGEV